MRRLRALTIAALTVPVSLSAQQPATNSITRSFKGMSYYGNWLLAAFDSIPESKYDYRPTPAQQTVGYIAQHLEDANYQLCTLIGGVKPTLTAKDSLVDTVKAKWPKDTLVARLKASLMFCASAMDRIDDTKLADELTVGPPGSTRRLPRARFLLLFVTDLAEHYSQIAGYMRLNGMVPPSALPRPKP